MNVNIAQQGFTSPQNVCRQSFAGSAEIGGVVELIYIIGEGNSIFFAIIKRNEKIPGKHHFSNNCMDSWKQVIQILGAVGCHCNPVNNILQDFFSLPRGNFNCRSNPGWFSFVLDGGSR